MTEFTPDPTLDLVLERTIPVPPERVWAAWTEPELLVQWFTPAPWRTASVDVDVRPGGRYVTTMESPDGEQFPSAGCYLHVEPGRLLVFTSMLTEGFRPVAAAGDDGELGFTARIEIAASPDGGTHYRAIAMHADERSCARHAEMGFADGWGAALDQLVDLMTRSVG
jgi:uncharacterized protein YndB with AHSA1/START domain